MKVGLGVVALTAVEGRKTEAGSADDPFPWLSVMSEVGVRRPMQADVVMVAGH
jgi:hypothetical protein